ncbi:hypothetical protein SVIOM342S_06053 [Streptomyces violaceorubidus]
MPASRVSAEAIAARLSAVGLTTEEHLRRMLTELTGALETCSAWPPAAVTSWP